MNFITLRSRKFATSIATLLLVLAPSAAHADAGLAASIDMMFNPTSGQLSAHGNWSWTNSACPAKNPDKYVGVALFINGAAVTGSGPSTALPVSSNNVLDKVVQLVTGSPCTAPANVIPTGTWSSATHNKLTDPVLATMPTKVCVVAYDAKKDGSGNFPVAGAHSLVPTGTGLNTDNSYTINNPDQYLPGACITPSLLPTLTVAVTPVNNNGGTVTSFPITIDGNAASNGAPVYFTPGPRTVVVSAPNGYSVSYSGACDANGNVSLSAGQNLTCTVTVDDIQPMLTINWTVINDETPPGTATVADFHFFAGVTEFVNQIQAGLNAGTYSVSKTGPTGYTSTYADDCVGGSVLLAPGDVKVCNIENNDNTPLPPEKGTITVTKSVPNNNGGTKTDFSLKVDGESVENGVATEVDPGTFTVSTDLYPGYAVTIGGDCAPDGTVIVEAGEDAECTITFDDLQGTLVVKKVVVGDAEPAYDDFSFSINGAEPQVFDADGENSVQVDAGTYVVTESAEGYQTIYDNCDVTVGNGETKTCTITNTKLGRVVVKKVTNLPETEQVFTFETDGSDYLPFTIGNGATNEQLVVPGVYGVREVTDGLPAGWVLTSATCSDGSQIDEVDVEAGETVTCTFTNTYTEPHVPAGALSIVKRAIGGDGEFEFTLLSGEETVDTVTVQTAGGLGTTTVSNLAPGVYSVIEGTMPNDHWGQTGTTCAEVTVTDGETAVCTITNTYSEFAADVSVTKEVSDSTPKMGSTLTYTLTVANGSEVYAANGVIVHDALPTGVTLVGAQASYGSFATSTGVWTIGTLNAGSSETLTLTVTVNSGTAGQTIVNTATVSNDQSTVDNNQDNNTASVSFKVYRPSGGGSSGSRPEGEVLGASTGEVLGESCGLYMDQHLRRGSAKNNAAQVTKLQQFLVKHGFATFAPTGYFGPLTEKALKAFQTKYADAILKPWNIPAPTGIAYLTTIRQINLIECPELMIEMPTLIEWSRNPKAQ